MRFIFCKHNTGGLNMNVLKLAAFSHYGKGGNPAELRQMRANLELIEAGLRGYTPPEK